MPKLPPYDPSKKKAYFPIGEWVRVRIKDVQVEQAESGDEVWKVVFQDRVGNENTTSFYFGEKSVWKVQQFLFQSGIKTQQELTSGLDVQPKHLQGWDGEIMISKGAEKKNSPGKFYWNLEARPNGEGDDAPEGDVPF